MGFEKRHFIQIAVCALITTICLVVYVWYYNTYLKPKSYVIGSPETMAYEKLPIKDYLSKDNVLFSMNINDVSFKNANGTATYEYKFNGMQYNGLVNDYSLFVNDIVLADVENAGTLKATHTLKYINVENKVFDTTDISIDFAFGTNVSTMRVTLPSEDLGLLMSFFKNNNYIITVSLNPFDMDNVITDNEFGRITAQFGVSNQGSVYVEYNNQLKQFSTGEMLVDRHGSMKIFTVLGNDIKSVKVTTDGTYKCNFNENTKEYTIIWENANYLNIAVEYTASGLAA